MLQDILSDVTKVYPPLTLSVFVADITAFMHWEEQGIGGDGRQGFEDVEERGRGEGLEGVDH